MEETSRPFTQIAAEKQYRQPRRAAEAVSEPAMDVEPTADVPPTQAATEHDVASTEVPATPSTIEESVEDKCANPNCAMDGGVLHPCKAPGCDNKSHHMCGINYLCFQDDPANQEFGTDTASMQVWTNGCRNTVCHSSHPLVHISTYPLIRLLLRTLHLVFIFILLPLPLPPKRNKPAAPVSIAIHHHHLPNVSSAPNEHLR